LARSRANASQYDRESAQSGEAPPTNENTAVSQIVARDTDRISPPPLVLVIESFSPSLL